MSQFLFFINDELSQTLELFVYLYDKSRNRQK